MVGKKEKYIAHFNEVYDKTFFAVRRFVALKCGDIDDIPDIILSKDRKKAGVTAPAHGLMLYKLHY